MEDSPNAQQFVVFPYAVACRDLHAFCLINKRLRHWDGVVVAQNHLGTLEGNTRVDNPCASEVTRRCVHNVISSWKISPLCRTQCRRFCERKVTGELAIPDKLAECRMGSPNGGGFSSENSGWVNVVHIQPGADDRRRALCAQAMFAGVFTLVR